jgi:hypothetical protein
MSFYFCRHVAARGGECFVWTMDRVDFRRLARAVLTAPSMRRTHTFSRKEALCHEGIAGISPFRCADCSA